MEDVVAVVVEAVLVREADAEEVHPRLFLNRIDMPVSSWPRFVSSLLSIHGAFQAAAVESMQRLQRRLRQIS